METNFELAKRELQSLLNSIIRERKDLEKKQQRYEDDVQILLRERQNFNGKKFIHEKIMQEFEEDKKAFEQEKQAFEEQKKYLYAILEQK